MIAQKPVTFLGHAETVVFAGAVRRCACLLPEWVSLFSFVSFGRVAMMAVVCVVLAACTQTGGSTYSGKLGPEAASLTKQQKAKILAARKRAAIKRARNVKMAAKERKARLKKRRTMQTALLAKTKKSRRKAKKNKLSTRKAARASKKGKLRRRGKAGVSKSKRVRVKRKSSAFVGGRSRGIAWNAPSRCLPGRLKKVLGQVSRKFGRVTVNSTVRGPRRNRMVGGKRRSYHLRCRAVDFRVHGRTRGLTRWLARHPSVGGFKRYRAGYFHIDTGPKRSW